MKLNQNIKKHLQGISIHQLIANFRTEYISKGINEKALAKNPIDEFEKWFYKAVKNKVREPNLMHLSTANLQGKPAGRIILLKDFDENGFVFFTNLESRKAKELRENNFAALTFLWLELVQQIRIEGVVTPISKEESDKYFNSRPRGSQIGAWASSQSHEVADRTEIEKRVKEFKVLFKNKPIPRPENWGGFCLSPKIMEFWQGRVNRLHDRIQYQLEEDTTWKVKRLFP
ncbi:pyridoxamine 5'-phosphate oxidase [Gillisia sp. Hel_I_86]|uniref:pyridoxamine 5'-phosphate oxidase n=1 Tax=Gillisia sp. Hel_I_86 TaxID=1249981 RepID=UPI00119AECD5|nr:pyridoxamine 5'-phosphate oxidase [Gillisia sp. Hel_I_86]TVZ27511.1 pyridoxamine 5'-phosphate oxidase [Gillisia sp. Hel_I_86]